MYTFIFISLCFGISFIVNAYVISDKSKKNEFAGVMVIVMVVGSILLNVYLPNNTHSEDRISSQTYANPIKSQFSAWNGAHRKLEEMIIGNMHDPESYEHLETRYKEKSDYLHVVTKYRGKNPLGNTVIKVISARCDLETGDVISIK